MNWIIEVLLFLFGFLKKEERGKGGKEESIEQSAEGEGDEREVPGDAGEVQPRVRAEDVQTVEDDPDQLTPNFHLSEFACNDAARTPVPVEYRANVQLLAENLEVLRAACGGSVITLNSAYRTKAHNTAIGGSPRSQHLLSKAGDIVVRGFTPKQVSAKIEKLINEGRMYEGGLGVYRGFVHYDVRGVRRRWVG